MLKKIGLLFVVALALAPTAFAQETGVRIQWPPPVTETFGVGNVIGTANVPDMAYYYLEYLPLADDLSLPPTIPWIPATMALTIPVSEGALATIDTRMVEDGLYALRLTVVTKGGQVFHDVISPLRVSNARFARLLGLEEEGDGEDTVEPVTPTPAPTEPPVVDNTPRVTPAGNVAVNVRRCDLVDDYRCAVVTSLGAGQVALATAVSARTPGWFQITTPAGAVGWVSASVVNAAGAINTLPAVFPPEPLPPLPPPSNAIPTGMGLPGGDPVCGVPYQIHINMGNTGQVMSNPGAVSVQAVNLRTGDVTFSGQGNFPAINPGGNFVVVVQAQETVYFNEVHELRARAGGQEFRISYTLQQGSCGVVPTPTPPPPVVNPGRDFPENQCFIVLTNEKVFFSVPYGDPRGRLAPAPYMAERVELVNGAIWFRLRAPDYGSVVWLADGGIETQGNCALNPLTR